MKNITLGSTGITAPQDGFGALPIQRVSMDKAVSLVRRAYEGGMIFFDTARHYSDSEEKLGTALEGYPRESYFIATKTMAKTPEKFREELDISLKKLKTDYIDIYQFHCAQQAYRPGDGTGMYECMLRARDQGKIRHIGITAHLLNVAEAAVDSGLYETLQYPLSHISLEKEIALTGKCREKNMGFIGMKGMAGGLIRDSRAAMAFIAQFDNVMPVWGIQRDSELDEWLSYMDDTPELDDELRRVIERDRGELTGEFCRGCGYCMPCPEDIMINQCARMALLLRRAPSSDWLTPQMQAEMRKIENCRHCGNCAAKCPYGLDTPALLAGNYEDYKRVLSGEVKV